MRIRHNVKIAKGTYLTNSYNTDGCLYWLFIGWWWSILKYMFLIPYWIIKAIWKAISGNSKTAHKSEQPNKSTQNTVHSEIPMSFQADNAIRIITESFVICQKTATLDVYESRLELAYKNARLLKELEEKGVYAGTPNADFYLNKFNDISYMNNSFLQRAYDHALAKAQKELTTETGIHKRMVKFFEQIDQTTLQFDESLLQTLRGAYING